MKLAWHGPRQTHTYFVDHLLSCNHTSVWMDITTRYVKFVKGLQASPSMEVAVLCGVVSGDVRSTTERDRLGGWTQPSKYQSGQGEGSTVWKVVPNP